eukprot:gene27626-36362_t
MITESEELLNDPAAEEGIEKNEDEEVIAQYQTARVRVVLLLWTSYKRIFQLTKNAVITLDPTKFTVTNRFLYSSIIDLKIDEHGQDQFILEYGTTKFTYQTAFRSHLLCQLFECISKIRPDKFRRFGPYTAERLHKDNSRTECRLTITSFGIVESFPNDQLIQEYKWVNITKLGVDNHSKGLHFVVSGRLKIFFSSSDLSSILQASRDQVKQLGITDTELQFISDQSVEEAIDLRKALHRSL